MKSRFRVLSKWIFRIFLILVIVFGVWMAILAYPQPFFGYNGQYGCCTVYSDEPFPDDFKDIMDDVNNRLKTFELHDSTKAPRIFLSNNPSRFAFFARLTLLQPDLQGYNLSIFGNTHICVERIKKLHQAYTFMPKYAITEGSLAHIITHEIMHQYFVDRFGRIANMNLPVWKREGLCEFGANIGVIRADSSTSLKQRIGLLNDYNNWDDSFEHARNHYRWELMIEYLAEEKKYTLSDIFADSVTYEAAYASMSDWYNNNPE